MYNEIFGQIFEGLFLFCLGTFVFHIVTVALIASVFILWVLHIGETINEAMQSLDRLRNTETCSAHSQS